MLEQLIVNGLAILLGIAINVLVRKTDTKPYALDTKLVLLVTYVIFIIGLIGIICSLL